ncbi:MAG: DMT family transporter [Frankiaceae bacterium]
MTLDAAARTATRAAAADRARVRTGTALVALSAASFGGMPIIAKLVYADGSSAIGLLATRFTIAGLILLLLARWRGESLPRGRMLLSLLALGGVGYAGESLCYFLALDHASAGVVALLLYLYPVLVVLLMAATARQRPSRLTVGCLLAAVAGSALTVGPSGGADAIGVTLGLSAAAAYALYIALSGRVLGHRSAVGPLMTSAVLMAAAGVTDDGLALATRADLPAHASGWIGVLGVALICTVVAVTALLAGLARIGPARASILSTLEPVVSVALGVAVLGEPMSAVQACGAVLVLTGVVVLAVRGTGAGADRPASAAGTDRRGTGAAPAPSATAPHR